MQSVLKKFYLCVFFLFASAIGVSLLFNRLVWLDLTKPFIEGVLFCGVLLAVVFHQRLRQFLINLPPIHQSMLGIFLFLMIVSQLIHFPSTTFPFVVWSMYSGVKRVPSVENITYWGIDGQGNKRVVIPARIFSAVGSRFAVSLENKLGRIRNYTGPEEEWSASTSKSAFAPIRLFMLHEPSSFSLDEKKDQLREILKAIGMKYNRENPDNPLVAVEVQRKTMDLASGQWIDPEIIFQAHLGREESGP